ncbi:MAG: arylmalonate decarboxylase [Hyphomicrobiaceae bacterium TMED74]|nr:arylmalonate decarboxylase [Filomicrobium sp.]RPG41148.1 MAG: arylmalonate decarboxylase [Hyphomicrobiaceae bacterium TMED74]
MVDALGYRRKFAVVAPSTNTIVQPEFDAMAPCGVTNHFSRIHIPDDPLGSDADFEQLMVRIRAELMVAVDRAMTAKPDYLVMGMSSETFWGGLDGSKELERKLVERSGLNIAMGSDASQAALRAFGDIRRISVVTPYMPVGDEEVRKFFTDCGFEVLAVHGLKCESPTAIAHVDATTLRDAVREVDDPQVEAILQVGTNLAFAYIAPIAEFWLDKPVLAINTATYWWGLRQNNITDHMDGFGSLLRDH